MSDGGRGDLVTKVTSQWSLGKFPWDWQYSGHEKKVLILRLASWNFVFQVFDGNKDSDTVVTHALSPKIRHTRYVRFVPITWHTRITLRVEVYGCKEWADTTRGCLARSPLLINLLKRARGGGGGGEGGVWKKERKARARGRGRVRKNNKIKDGRGGGREGGGGGGWKMGRGKRRREASVPSPSRAIRAPTSHS